MIELAVDIMVYKDLTDYSDNKITVFFNVK